jgi:hypothetical protein
MAIYKNPHNTSIKIPRSYKRIARNIPEEIVLDLCIKLRTDGHNDKEICNILFDNYKIGVKDKTGTPIRPYKPSYISRLVREAMDKLHEQNLEGATEYNQLQLMRLEELYKKWKTRAETDPKAAEFCRKLLQDLTALTGANAPIRVQVVKKIEEETKQLTELLRRKLPDDVFIQVIQAIRETKEEYYASYTQESERPIIEATVEEIRDVH